MRNLYDERRYGTFLINKDMIIANPLDCLRVMSTVIVTRAEQKMELDAIEYVGLSSHFEPVQRGQIPPCYEALLVKDENGFPHLKGWRKL